LGDAGGAYERLGRSGILVRRFDDHPRWLRFGLPPEEGWDRLQAARSALSGWPA
jgi:cobalamin biosynthetic protein CobC